MARSEEAILRRALKRNRTEGEQRQADRNEMKRQALKQAQKAEAGGTGNKRPRVSESRTERTPGNRGASRDRGNPRHGPNSSISSSRRPTAKKPRHDEETSKKLVWARQADSTTLSKNQELRQKYKETGGEGMDPKDLERAKLLIARDERKKERKNKKKKTTDNTTTTADAEGTKESPPKKETPAVENSSSESKKSPESSDTNKKNKNSSQAKRDQNKALRKRYLETNGVGMKKDQIERAKLLIARDQKKKQRRAQQKQQEEQKTEKKQ